MKTRRTLLATLVAAAVAATTAGAADTYTFDKVHSDVGFQIRHLVSKVRGRFTDYDGTIVVDKAKPEASSVELKIKTASIDTGNENRDKDLRSANFFEVEKYPEITFKSTRITPKGGDRYDVTGTLTMHGVSKEVTLPVTFLGFVSAGRMGDRAGFETAITLNRKDYGIVWNRPLDVGGTILGDDVLVSINVEANKKQPPSPATGE
jgi:polyisoprenoid-binding protein YceI